MSDRTRATALSCLLFCMIALPVSAAAPGSITAKDYTFIGKHDEIVAKATKEGKLRILTTMDDADISRLLGSDFYDSTISPNCDLAEQPREIETGQPYGSLSTSSLHEERY